MLDITRYDDHAGYARGTRGGHGGKVVTVKTGDELNAAAAARSKEKSPEPVIWFVDGDITDANTKGSAIDIKKQSRWSLIGNGTAKITDVGVHVADACEDFVIGNLDIARVNQGPKDAIGVEKNCQMGIILHNRCRGSMQVDKDHFDGLCDLKHNTRKIAIIFNEFFDHHKVGLVGSSDSDIDSTEITWNHNYYHEVGSRCPLLRGGKGHFYNNYLKNVETSGCNIRQGAEALIENNVFENVHNPIVSEDSKTVGKWNLKGNLIENPTWGKVEKGEASAQNGASTTDFQMPYTYALRPVEEVKAFVTTWAGVLLDGKGVPGQGAPVPPVEPEQPVEEPGQTEQPQHPAEEEPEVVDLGPIAVALDEAEAALAKVRRLLGAG
jgi:pectate lyase